MITRLGQIQYINALPIFHALAEGIVSSAVELVPGTPTELNERLASADIDAAFVSSYEYLRHRDRYTLVPDLGIAADGPVLSVNLYVREDLGSLEGQPIALTNESATSAELVRILCRDFWGVTPSFTSESDRAFLLIGDRALQQATIPGYRTIDLAAAWRDATGLPMVFALCVARRERMGALQDAIAALRSSLSWGLAHPEVILAEAAKRSSYPHLAKYYSCLIYHLGEREQRGLALYAKHAGYPSVELSAL